MKMRSIKLFAITAFCFFMIHEGHAQQDLVIVTPVEFQGALSNPLKGFRPDLNQAGNRKYDDILRHYIRWNEIEQHADDGVDKIIDFCNKEWQIAVENNSRVIPRVYIDWNREPHNEYWPDDLMDYIESIGKTTYDESLYDDPIIQDRFVKLIYKLGEAWDNDPRVAWIQMGIVGPWGEQHSPFPNLQLQKLLGDAFTDAFKNKKVLVRRPFQKFTDYEFGWYWDRFAHEQQGRDQADVMMRMFPDRWEKVPIEGEVGYGAPSGNPGTTPEETLKDPVHRQTFINWVRKVHASGVGWIANYDENDPDVAAGAEIVQKVFGYRFLLKEVTYPNIVQKNQSFSVSFKVENSGSAPFYYDWPIELRLLDSESHEVKWKQVFNSVDIRDWMPGEKWNENTQQYDVAAPIVGNTGTFKIENPLPEGKYILALAILDPAGGMVPAVRFATQQYFNGGNHPIGYIGINTNIEQTTLDPSVFDDPSKDNSLFYKIEN